MASFEQILGVEGCSSSESGWTMYISSSTQGDGAGNIEENDEYDGGINGGMGRHKRETKVDMEESDDSTVSDASSAPLHYHCTRVYRKDRKDGGRKYSSRKDANKPEKKRVDTRRNK
ncbi:uncharacterized protein LOC114722929 [Neltuma alba]|uniref:uncharacterized protein LOC114722929 n=1 Tax=Neltuma alba TaxID=207710 RepID=UPI0010A404A2|nr:uncharacterized protein LOC114722929 [Prosopis alba]